jgi:hypothetical protein
MITYEVPWESVPVDETIPAAVAEFVGKMKKLRILLVVLRMAEIEPPVLVFIWPNSKRRS